MAGKQTQYSILHWDSRLFGYTVARLGENCDREHLQRILHELKNLHIRLVYWFVDPSDVERKKAAVKNGGKLVDEKVTYSMKLSTNYGRGEKNSSLTSYTKKTTDRTLIPLALQSSIYSRFATDSHFVHNEYKKLYTTWVRRSIQREKAFDVIVYNDLGGTIRGFITLESKDKRGSIGLLAVDKTFRRQAIGSQLVGEAFRRFDRKGLTTVTVTTQKANAAACRFYEKLGFRILRTEHVYHFWL